MKARSLRLAGLCFLGEGIFLILIQFAHALWAAHITVPKPAITKMVMAEISVKQTAPEYPTYIAIPAISLQSTIVPQQEQNGIWPVQDQVVNIATDSAHPLLWGSFSNTGQAIVLYGHRSDVFFLLPSLLPTALIQLADGSGQHNYSVQSVQEVNASDTALLQTQFPNELILYTCDYFTDAERVVVIAKGI